MKRDELLKNIEEEVKKVLPEDVDLSEESEGEEGQTQSHLETFRDTVDEVLNNAEEALDDTEGSDAEPNDAPDAVKE